MKSSAAARDDLHPVNVALASAEIVALEEDEAKALAEAQAQKEAASVPHEAVVARIARPAR